MLGGVMKQRVTVITLGISDLKRAR
ncbi:MAG: hypothetical protein QOE67_1133, partial [Solirubrobacteraceae bacterium]|nr:hypothetical protein [Solirubrobacteraceae bacterium]